MKVDARPIVQVEVSLKLDQSELAMLNRLCSYGLAVVEPIIGKDPLPHHSDPWEKFLRDVRSATAVFVQRLEDSNAVLMGEKRAVAGRQKAAVQTEELELSE